jgi:hypothetical protein
LFLGVRHDQIEVEPPLNAMSMAPVRTYLSMEAAR